MRSLTSRREISPGHDAHPRVAVSAMPDIAAASLYAPDISAAAADLPQIASGNCSRGHPWFPSRGVTS